MSSFALSLCGQSRPQANQGQVGVQLVKLLLHLENMRSVHWGDLSTKKGVDIGILWISGSTITVQARVVR